MTEVIKSLISALLISVFALSLNGCIFLVPVGAPVAMEYFSGTKEEQLSGARMQNEADWSKAYVETRTGGSIYEKKDVEKKWMCATTVNYNDQETCIPANQTDFSRYKDQNFICQQKSGWIGEAFTGNIRYCEIKTANQASR